VQAEGLDCKQVAQGNAQLAMHDNALFILYPCAQVMQPCELQVKQLLEHAAHVELP
jgi:hypothetical protein